MATKKVRKILKPKLTKSEEELEEMIENPPFPPSPEVFEIISKLNVPTSELVSRVYSNSLFNVTPQEYFKYFETEPERIYPKINFDVMMGGQEKNKKKLVSHIKFEDNFKKAIQHPTEKTKKAADSYPDWFKMCCHLKFLFSEIEEKGLELFKLFSSLSKKYREKECEKLWKDCQPKFGIIPGVFSIIDFPKSELAKIPNRKQIIKNEFFS